MTEIVEPHRPRRRRAACTPRSATCSTSWTRACPRGRCRWVSSGTRSVYQQELRKVFGRCWVFMAHESEVEANGDYVVRKIGEDNFIVSRDEKGETPRPVRRLPAPRRPGLPRGLGQHVPLPLPVPRLDLLHRRLPGRRPAVAQRVRRHGQGQERPGPGGAGVAATYGLIFATLDPTAPPLEEYLGGMAWYLDLLFGLDAEGLEVLGAPQRFVVDANWKSGADNFSGDDYHLGTLHRSVWEIGAFPVPFRENMMGYHIQAAPGHSLSFSMAPDEDEPGPEVLRLPRRPGRELRHQPDQPAPARHRPPLAGVRRQRLPELLHPRAAHDRGRQRAPADRDHHDPHLAAQGPGQIEIWNWFLGYKRMTPEQKDRAYRAGLGTFSVGGAFEMDDTEPWITVGRTGRSVAAEVLDFQLNYEMGMPGIGIATRVDRLARPRRRLLDPLRGGRPAQPLPLLLGRHAGRARRVAADPRRAEPAAARTEATDQRKGGNA